MNFPAHRAVFIHIKVNATYATCRVQDFSTACIRQETTFVLRIVATVVAKTSDKEFLQKCIRLDSSVMIL